MAHGYFEIDYQLVWETVDSEIPKLISELAALLYDKNPGRVAED
jgi:uncharacterized protein with HEPN domain